MSPFAESSRSSVVLALRSSTRALPMAVLGLALGAGALVAATARRLSRHQLGDRRGGDRTGRGEPARRVERRIRRSRPVARRGSARRRGWRPRPSSTRCRQAFVSCSCRAPSSARSGGATPSTRRSPASPSDPSSAVTCCRSAARRPWTCCTRSTIVSRRGSPSRPSIAPIARLFGADTIWAPNDIWYDRFRSPRPELTAALFDHRRGGGTRRTGHRTVSRSSRRRCAAHDRRTLGRRPAGRHPAGAGLAGARRRSRRASSAPRPASSRSRAAATASSTPRRPG